MKVLSYLIMFVFICLISIECHAKDISGLYKNNVATVTIDKLNEAWEIECKSDKYRDRITYLYFNPFEGEVNSNDAVYHCSPIKKINDNIYRVSIKSNKKYKCGLLGDMVGQYDESDGRLTFSTLAHEAQMDFSANPPYIDMCMAEMDSDCGYLAGDYKKKK